MILAQALLARKVLQEQTLPPAVILYADERCVGNLGLSASGLFTRFIATHVNIRTSDTSSIPYDTPSQAYRTLPYHALSASAASVTDLSPVTSSAQEDSTSKLLRFL